MCILSLMYGYSSYRAGRRSRDSLSLYSHRDSGSSRRHRDRCADTDDCHTLNWAAPGSDRSAPSPPGHDRASPGWRVQSLPQDHWRSRRSRDARRPSRDRPATTRRDATTEGSVHRRTGERPGPVMKDRTHRQPRSDVHRHLLALHRGHRPDWHTPGMTVYTRWDRQSTPCTPSWLIETWCGWPSSMRRCAAFSFRVPLPRSSTTYSSPAHTDDTVIRTSGC